MKSLIDKYLHGQLSDQQRVDFIDKLNQDEEFAEEVKIRTIVFAEHKSNLKNKLLAIETNQTSTKEINRWRIPSFVKYAASIALVAVCFLTLYNPNQENETKELAYYAAPIQYRNDINENVPSWDLFISNYNIRDFSSAIKNVNQCIIENGYSVEYGFYLGLSYFYNSPQELDKAINEFNRFDKKSSKYYEEGLWFSGLAYFQKGKTAKAKEILTLIVDRKTWNYKEAQAILRDLK